MSDDGELAMTLYVGTDGPIKRARGARNRVKTLDHRHIQIFAEKPIPTSAATAWSSLPLAGILGEGVGWSRGGHRRHGRCI